jgi:hypothetical protein
MGVPGFLFFTGLMLIPIWYGSRRYLLDKSFEGAISGMIACSFIAFAIYRFTLSQSENHVLFFNLLAVLMVLRSLGIPAGADMRKSIGPKSPKGADLPQRAPVLARVV